MPCLQQSLLWPRTNIVSIFLCLETKKNTIFCTDLIEMRLISLFFSSQLLNRLADLGLDTKQMQPNYCNLISIFTIFSSLLVAELY